MLCLVGLYLVSLCPIDLSPGSMYTRWSVSGDQILSCSLSGDRVPSWPVSRFHISSWPVSGVSVSSWPVTRNHLADLYLRLSNQDQFGFIPGHHPGTMCSVCLYLGTLYIIAPYPRTMYQPACIGDHVPNWPISGDNAPNQLACIREPCIQLACFRGPCTQLALSWGLCI